jgi:hypothetical protein
MDGKLVSSPVLNKRITDFVSGIFGATWDSTTRNKILLVLALAALTIGIFAWYFTKYRTLEFPGTIQQRVLQNVKQNADYEKTTLQRKGLPDYLELLKRQTVPASHLALTNFYVSTVNGAGFFYPTYDGVFSTHAARLAVAAGARGFVFDIWPDLSPGANFGPILQVVEQGTLWRRISLNAISFASVLSTITTDVFLRYPNDIVYLYLRFRGTPRPSTFEGTLNALRGHMEPYRLDASFNACRGQDRLFKTPISSLYGRVLVFSNMRAQGTGLADYINSAPSEGIRTDWVPRDVAALTDTMRGEQKVKIQQNISVAALPLEDPASEANTWNWQESHALGIQMAALNLWNRNDSLNKYMAEDMFGIYSYKLKPESIRFLIELIPAPGQIEKLWEPGPNAGMLNPVEPIQTTP